MSDAGYPSWHGTKTLLVVGNAMLAAAAQRMLPSVRVVSWGQSIAGCRFEAIIVASPISTESRIETDNRRDYLETSLMCRLMPNGKILRLFHD